VRRRFFWSLVGVAGLTLGVLVLLAAVVSQRAQANAAERALLAVTAAVAEEIVDLQTSDTPIRDLTDGADLVRVLEQARRSTDSDIGLILRTPRRIRTTAPFIERFAIADEVEPGAVEVLDVGAGLVVARSVPLEQISGDVIVVAARRNPVVEWSNQVRTVLIGLVLAAIVAAVAARLLSGWVAARVGPLAAGAGRLQAGDLSARVPIDGSDELTSVAMSFNEMAEALEHSKERERQFLLSVGHDLRTPLTTIGGYAEALEDGIDDPEEIARIASIMTSEHRRLRRLIEDVMVLARLDSAEFGVVSEPVDVGAHVQEVVSRFEASAQSADVVLDVTVEPTGVRSIDPDRVGQILSNLIENAIRFTPADGSVSVGVESLPDAVEITVGDTGAGIEPEDLPHIFDRFYVARRYRGVRPAGSGLGLSIVERLATSMGGSISAVSRVGLGTEFHLVLPAPRVTPSS
jgi:two-component system sensor histidine kinase BaeS